MTNPFSPDYKPQIDLSDLVKESKQSKERSARRQAQLDSDDPAAIKQAKGGMADKPISLWPKTKGKRK